jgi:hypothetical protein
MTEGFFHLAGVEHHCSMSHFDVAGMLWFRTHVAFNAGLVSASIINSLVLPKHVGCIVCNKVVSDPRKVRRHHKEKHLLFAENSNIDLEHSHQDDDDFLLH